MRCPICRILVAALLLYLAVPAPGQMPAAPEAGSRPTLHTHLSAFGIPFRINADMAKVIEVQLYVSRDRGASWQFYARQATNRPEFPFQASGEGEYWFSLKTLDRNRQLLPAGDPQPELRIVVDQTQPTVDFRIETDQAGRIACRWDARDEHLDPDTFQILYRADTVSDPNHPDAQWHRVPVELHGKAINGRYSDQIAFWPELSGRELTVRVAVADRAGNQGYADRQIQVPAAAWRSRGESTARPEPANPPVGGSDNLSSSETAAAVAEPYGVVCENGVCHVPPPAASTDRTAHLAGGAGLPAPPRDPQTWVGSQPEYVAPPLPAGVAAQPAAATPGTRVAARPQGNGVPQRSPSTGESIAWPSQTMSPGPERFRKEATAFAPDTPQIPNFPRRSEVSRSVPPPPTASHLTASPMTAAPAGTTPERVADARGSQESPPPVVTRGDQNISEATTRSRTPDYLERQEQMRRQPGPEVVAGSPGWDPPTATPSEATTSPFRQTGTLGEIEPMPLETGAPLPADPETAQPINTRRFHLDYGIDSIDPSGVQRVDLWMTRDLGRTWTNWGTDPDTTSPFPVEVEEPGLYGFQIVIQSRDGLTGRPPQRGEAPDILVQVDTDAPRVEITKVPYGRGAEAGQLIIEWVATDPLMTLRPITLSYADQPTGPWTIIEKGLRNTGRYGWKAGADVPRKVYLRIEAADRAGNIGISTLSQPIDLSGLIPRARIRSVRPVGQ